MNDVNLGLQLYTSCPVILCSDCLVHLRFHFECGEVYNQGYNFFYLFFLTSEFHGLVEIILIR